MCKRIILLSVYALAKHNLGKRLRRGHIIILFDNVCKTIEYSLADNGDAELPLLLVCRVVPGLCGCDPLAQTCGNFFTEGNCLLDPIRLDYLNIWNQNLWYSWKWSNYICFRPPSFDDRYYLVAVFYRHAWLRCKYKCEHKSYLLTFRWWRRPWRCCSSTFARPPRPRMRGWPRRVHPQQRH